MPDGSRASKIAWFAGLWLASVAALALVAGLTRWLILP
jgi:hypothetical protein